MLREIGEIEVHVLTSACPKTGQDVTNLQRLAKGYHQKEKVTV